MSTHQYQPGGRQAPDRADRARRGGLSRRIAGVTGASALVFGISAITAPPASAVQSNIPPAPNPPMPIACEVDIALSIDLSNSITMDDSPWWWPFPGSSPYDVYLEEMVQFVQDMEDYPVRIAVHNWASYAPAHSGPNNAPLALTETDAAGIGVITSRIEGLTAPDVMDGATNWDRGFQEIRDAGEDYDLLLFVTDGNPTVHSNPPVGPGDTTTQDEMDHAVASANEVKTLGTRIKGVGVTDPMGSQELEDFHEHVPQITGPEVGFDYYETGLTELSETLREDLDAAQEDCIDNPPEAENDRNTTAPSTPVTTDVLENDTPGDYPLDPTTVTFPEGQQPAGAEVSEDGSSLIMPGEGEYEIDPETGEITFTPEDGFLGETTPVTYEVQDEEGNPAQANLIITVEDESEVPDGPEAEDDFAETDPGTPVDIPILDNDTPGSEDVPLDPTTVTFPEEGQPEGAEVSEDGKSITVPGEGEYVIDPETGEVVFTPEEGFTGETTPVDYVVEDEDGNPADASIIVTVTPEDEDPGDTEPPVAEDDVNTTQPSTPVTTDVLENDTPGDSPLDPTTVTFPEEGQPEGAEVSDDGQSLTVPGEGEYEIDPETGEITFTPEDGFTGETTPVTYEVEDEEGRPADAQLIITVEDEDGDPDGTPDGTVEGDPDGTPEGDPEGAPDGTPEGTVDGDPEGTPDGDPEGTPDGAEPGTEEGSPEGAPDGTPDGTPEGDPDGTPEGDPEGTPDGAEPGTEEGSPEGDPDGTPEGDPEGAPDGTPEGTVDGDPEGTPEGDPDGTPEGAPDGAEPELPVAEDDTAVTDPGTPVEIPILDNDTPGDSPLDPTTVTFPEEGQPEGSEISDDGKTITVPGEGEYAIDPETGDVIFTPEDGFTGETTPVDYVVEDEDGNPTDASIVVVVNPAEGDPDGTPDGTPEGDPDGTPEGASDGTEPELPVAEDDVAETDEGSPVEIPILDNDTPGDSPLDPGTVTFPEEGQPEGAEVSEDGKTITVPGEGEYVIDPDTGDVIFTPEDGFTGETTPVDYVVEDEDGNETGASIIVVVNPDEGDPDGSPEGSPDGSPEGSPDGAEPELPVAEDDHATTSPGESVTVPVLENDTPGDSPLDPTTVTFPEEGQPEGAVISDDGKTITVPGEGEYTIDPDTGDITFTPEDGFTGDTTPVTYEVEDEDGNPTQAQLTITVEPEGDAGTPDGGAEDAAGTPDGAEQGKDGGPAPDAQPGDSEGLAVTGTQTGAALALASLLILAGYGLFRVSRRKGTVA